MLRDRQTFSIHTVLLLHQYTDTTTQPLVDSNKTIYETFNNWIDIYTKQVAEMEYTYLQTYRIHIFPVWKASWFVYNQKLELR